MVDGGVSVVPPAAAPSPDSVAAVVDRRLSAIPPAARDLQGRRAGLITRLLANTVDFGVAVAIVAAGYAGVAALRFLWNSRTFTFPAPGFGILLLAGGVVMTLYLTACWTVSGRTYGDHLLGLRVLGLRGGRPRPIVALLRAVLCVLFPIGLFWIVVSRDNRSVQDVLLRSSVVYDWSRTHSVGVAERPAEAAAEQGLLGAVRGEGEGAQLGRPGLLAPAELDQDVAADGVVEVVAVQLGGEAVELPQRGGRAGDVEDRDRAVEPDDRRGPCISSRSYSARICGQSVSCQVAASVWQATIAAWSWYGPGRRSAAGTVEHGQRVRDHRPVPAAAVLVGQQDQVVAGGEPAARPGQVQPDQGEQAERLGVPRVERAEQAGQRGRLGGQVPAGRRAVRAGQVALVEHQVEHGERPGPAARRARPAPAPGTGCRRSRSCAGPGPAAERRPPPRPRTRARSARW